MAKTKSQILSEVATKAGVTKAQAEQVLDALNETLIDTVKEEGAVAYFGLLKIAKKSRPARQVRNPATGAMIDKPADSTLKISPMKALKDALAD